MSSLKKIIISISGAILITGSGLILMEMGGGYGPCGPAGNLSHLGSILSISHCNILFLIFSESFIHQIGIPDAFLCVGPAIINWSIILFIGLTIYNKIKKKSNKVASPNSETADANSL